MKHDAVVVGAGPGGSTVAWSLARRGVKVLLLDSARFPRVKLCAGWVTKSVLADLEIDPRRYPLTLQPFQHATLELDDRSAETRWPETASFGIVRREFDHFLLERARHAGAKVREGDRVTSIERVRGGVRVSSRGGTLEAPLVIGAGGHGCPVARAFGELSEDEAVVVTQESETRIGEDRLAELAPRPGVPELYPESDLRGYGWYFPKRGFLNVGIGALDDGRGLHRRTERFVERLRQSGRLPGDLPLEPFRGHAYAIRVASPRCAASAVHLLVGDAAGLARGVSGEGIGPAVASARLAAAAASEMLAGDRESAAERYRRAIDERFGRGHRGWLGHLADRVPPSITEAVGRYVCRNDYLRRRLVFEGAFGMG